MSDVLIYWRDYRQNRGRRLAGEQAWHWHSNARVLGNLVPADRLWLVTSGKCLRQEAEQAGFLVAVWQVREVIDNPDDDPAYPADVYRYRVIADESNSQNFGETPILVDHILRPARASKSISIGRYLQGPRKLDAQTSRLLRAAAGPQMAQQWLTGKRQPSQSQPANTEQPVKQEETQ